MSGPLDLESDRTGLLRRWSAYIPDENHPGARLTILVIHWASHGYSSAVVPKMSAPTQNRVGGITESLKNPPRLKNWEVRFFSFTKTVSLFKDQKVRISRGRNSVFYFGSVPKPMKRASPLDIQPSVTAGTRILQPPWAMLPMENAESVMLQGEHWLQTKNTFHWTKEIAESVTC